MNEFQETNISENEPERKLEQQEEITLQPPTDNMYDAPDYRNYNVQPQDSEPPKKKKWQIPVASCCAILIIVLAVLLGTHVICLSHDWQPATCTEPKTCAKCHRTQGEPLGHDWLKATCAEPITCSRCGETDGEPLGHIWEDATCTEPKTCSVCGETNGNPLGHDWKDATCTEPKICKVCGETEGKALGHTAGEQTILRSDVVEGYYVVGETCTVCGELIDSRITPYTTLVSNKKFVCTPAELMERTGNAMDEIAGCDLIAGTKTTDSGLFGVAWDTDGSAVFAAKFIGLGEDNVIEDANSTETRGLLGYFRSDDNGYFTSVLMGLLRACDPSLSFDEAKTLGKAVIMTYLTGDSYDHNGIQYIVTQEDGNWILGISVIQSESENHFE